MQSDEDLRYAISLRPHPFPNLDRSESPRVSQSERDPTSSERGQERDRKTSTPKPAASIKSGHVKGGTSTSYEPTTPPAVEQTDPVARNVSRFDTASVVEGQRPPHYTPESDPYQLASRIKSQSEIESIKANTSKKRSEGCVPGLRTTKGAFGMGTAKKVQTFYENQNENIERLLKPVDDHRREAKEEEGADQLKFKIAVQGSFTANVILAALQLYAATSSSSLSLFTTMADALFDPLSNVMLILSARAVNRVDPRKFPSGKARIETAGNIVFCFLMTAVSFIIIVMSIKELSDGSTADTKGFHLSSVISVAVAFCTKLCLFFYCWALRNKYSQIRILWEDHRNDLLINGFGILTSVGGSKLKWWIDPMGAIILSCLIVFLWLRTAYSEFQLLIGVSADTPTLQLITYISMTHDPLVKAIDTVRAWHSGPRLIVEVDIVMEPEETLQATHDVAEELQTKLESLPNVERAYVHVDYETSHAPEHFWKKEL